MKKYLLLWVVACLALLILPKIIDRFTPKVIYKEVPVYRIKTVIKEVEKPVYQGEKIVEKEKIVYQPTPEGMFNAVLLENGVYKVTPSSKWGVCQVKIWGDSNGVYFKRDDERFSNPTVSASTVGFYQ